MFREDVLFLIPALLLLLFQLRFVKRLPEVDQDMTEISGEYTLTDHFKFHYLQNLILVIFLMQLVFIFLEVRILPAALLYLIGYFLLIIGLLIYFLAFKTLGTNWSAMHQYRIKKDQKLVTNGIYKLIRHPIYLAVILEIVGFEIVARSYLFIILGALGFLFFFSHIKKEEGLLKLKFKQQFIAYQKKTKMLIPYVF